MSTFINDFSLKLNHLTSFIHRSIGLTVKIAAIYTQLIICLLPTRLQNWINGTMLQIARLLEDQITYILLFSDPSRMASRVVNWFNLTDPLTVLRLSRKLYLQSSDASLRERLSNSVLSYLAKGFSTGRIRPHRRLLASLERWTLRAYQENKLCQLLTAFTNSQLFGSIWCWVVPREESPTYTTTISFVRSTLYVAQHFTAHHSNLCVSLQLLLDRLNSNNSNNDVVIVETTTSVHSSQR